MSLMISDTAPMKGNGGKMIASPGMSAVSAATTVASSLASASDVGFIFLRAFGGYRVQPPPIAAAGRTNCRQ